MAAMAYDVFIASFVSSKKRSILRLRSYRTWHTIFFYFKDMVTANKKKPWKKEEQREVGFETISQRVRRHLRDIKSQITDDDVRNARVELEVENKNIYD